MISNDQNMAGRDRNITYTVQTVIDNKISTTDQTIQRCW